MTEGIIQCPQHPCLHYSSKQTPDSPIQAYGAVRLTDVCVSSLVEALHEPTCTYTFFTTVILRLIVPFDPQTRTSVKTV